jgi:ATP-dependent Lhr-like helicase
VLEGFHPAVARWFDSRFPGPTPPQRRGWAEIQAGRDTLIAAPTGSGKTLAAFLACVDQLVRDGLEGRLEDRTEVLYVSPLKALGNDIQKNLAEPLLGISAAAAELGLTLPEIRTSVRSGDTPSSERQAMLRRPPHLLLTTPESLYLLLTSTRGRQMLSTVRTVILDEIHAVADDKRGAHLSLSMERLAELTGAPLRRIGLSATQHPIEEIARFLVGSSRIDAGGNPDCAIVDETRLRDLDLAIEIPKSPLEAVASGEHWGEVYDRVAEMVAEHRTTLVFVNTRRLVERVAHALGVRLGESAVAAHHGSLSRQHRLKAEEQLKRAEVKVVVATASLELGIDVGAVELVCQIGSPRSLSVGVQRIGRSGHSFGATPKGRFFPLTRDELIECAALVRGLRKGRLDRIEVRRWPLDILAQQIVALAACEGWEEDRLFDVCRKAWPYAALPREEFDKVVQLLSGGVAPGRGRAMAHLHRDGVHHRVTGRRGARLAALTSGGAIPDQANYAVVAEPEGLTVGSLDEDFAIESMAGDIFLLGNTSWKIRRIETGRVRVEDAHGAAPSIPFWNGEAPGRSAELSEEVSALRAEIEPMLETPQPAARWLAAEGAMPLPGAEQAVAYLAAGRASLGALPTQQTLIAERFFDEAGGMQLILHAPFGARLNRAFGLALRKRFCRSFNFELQAAATDDGILLSLGPQHSFPLDAVFEFLSPNGVREVLEQAVLGAPMFGVRWRWNATRSLALLRNPAGRKVPPPILRMRSEDLLAAVFPQQAACQENVTGPIEIPDHPLVQETLRDCLTEALDFEGLEALLHRMASGELRLLARDLPEPSPLCYELLNSHPYTFLDDAPLEERRARAVATRRTLAPKDAADLGALDAAAIAEVEDQAWPRALSQDELHDALLGFILFPAREAAPGWDLLAAALGRDGRLVELPSPKGPIWVAQERADHARAALAGDDEAILEVVRGWIECLGPTSASALGARLPVPEGAVEGALARLEASGLVLRGSFTPGASQVEWCERGLLARIHRLTLGRLRREIEPVASTDLLRFLFRWQHLEPGTQLHGVRGLAEVVAQLQGFPAAAGSWERSLLPARVSHYDPTWLDQLCLSGEVAWGRLSPAADREPLARRARPTRTAPIALMRRVDLPWLLAADRSDGETTALGPAAASLRDLLGQRGASFFTELLGATGRIRTDLEQALWELVSAGEVTCDGFAGLRVLIGRRHHAGPHAARGRGLRPLAADGRWSLLRPGALPEGDRESTLIEPWVRQLLTRYGVVFRDLLAREAIDAPWRELVGVLRRLEARGELRGGRFVAAFSGEQFALPSAVEALRAVRRIDGSQERVTLSAADPLNLVGILTPGGRAPALLGNAVTYVGGVPQTTADAPARPSIGVLSRAGGWASAS